MTNKVKVANVQKLIHQILEDDKYKRAALVHQEEIGRLRGAVYAADVIDRLLSTGDAVTRRCIGF